MSTLEISQDDCQLRALHTTQEFLRKFRARCGTHSFGFALSDLIEMNVNTTRQISDIFLHYFLHDSPVGMDVRQEAMNMSINKNTSEKSLTHILKEAGKFKVNTDFFEHAMPLFEDLVENIAHEALVLCQSAPAPQWASRWSKPLGVQPSRPWPTR